MLGGEGFRLPIGPHTLKATSPLQGSGDPEMDQAWRCRAGAQDEVGGGEGSNHCWPRPVPAARLPVGSHQPLLCPSLLPPPPTTGHRSQPCPAAGVEPERIIEEHVPCHLWDTLTLRNSLWFI